MSEIAPRTDGGRWDVAIVGGGPVGLLLAGQLAERQVRAVVLERATAPATLAKANGIVGRTAVELRRRGILTGPAFRVRRPSRFSFGSLVLRLGIGPWTPGNPLHILLIPQVRLEQLLEARAVRSGVELRRGQEFIGFTQNADDVTLDLRAPAPTPLRARFLVGCDGAHSLVRKQAGIDFPGHTGEEIVRIARVTIPTSKIARIVDRSQISLKIAGVGTFTAMTSNRLSGGRFSIAPVAVLDPAAPMDRYVIAVHELRNTTEAADHSVTIEELRASLRRVLGADLPFTDATDLRATIGNSRLAESYRSGRVFLAGDAAHSFGAGGTALNIGLQDALDLADRLSAVLRDNASEDDLDGYHTARHAAGRLALQHTRVQAALSRNDDEGQALRETLGPAITRGRAARRLARLLEQA